MGLGPTLLAGIMTAMSEQKALEMLTGLVRNANNRGPGANQVTHGFVFNIWNPDGCQFADSMQFGKHARITAIGLHTVARLHRNKRGSDNHAALPEVDKLTVKPIATRASLIAMLSFIGLSSIPEALHHHVWHNPRSRMP